MAIEKIIANDLKRLSRIGDRKYQQRYGEYLIEGVRLVEEAFRDGVIETWEREILGAAARILKVPIDLQCRIVVETQKRYWQDQLRQEGSLDKLVLYGRLYGLANRDGVVNDSERELLERVAALLKLTPEQIEEAKRR